MSKKLLFALWGGLFILCAGLGFIPGFSQNVSAGAQAVLTVLAVAFFAPPTCLIYGAKKEKDARTLKLVRGISLLSLGLTLLALVQAFFAAADARREEKAANRAENQRLAAEAAAAEAAAREAARQEEAAKAEAAAAVPVTPPAPADAPTEVLPPETPAQTPEEPAPQA